MTNKHQKKIYKFLKISAWTVGILLFIVILLVYSLRLPVVQDFITKEAIKFYNKKVDAKASIGRLYVDFPSNITIEEIYLEDQEQDTLLYANYISVQTDLWALIDNELKLSNIELNNIVANVDRPKTSESYNFQFIIDGFAPADTTTSDSSAFDFSIGDVVLSNAQIKYFDNYTGLRYSGDISTLEVVVDEFNLNNSHIHIGSILLENAESKLYLFEGGQPNTIVQTNDTTSTENAFNFGGDKVTLKNVDFLFEDNVSKMKINNRIGDLTLEIDEIDISKNVYTARQILIKNSFVSFDQFVNSDSVVTAPEVSNEAVELLAGSKSVQIENTSFRYADHNVEKTPTGFDPSHLWIQKLQADLRNTYFSNGDIKGRVQTLSFNEQNGLVLSSLQTDWSFAENGSYAKNLSLKTNRSSINGDVIVDYPSLPSISENINTLSFDVNLKESFIDFRDAFYFQPDLQSQLSLINPNYRIKLSTIIKGRLDDLAINTFKLSAINNTHLTFNGNVKGLPEINDAYFSVKDFKFNSTSSDIKSVLPDTLLPDNIAISKHINTLISFEGSLADFKSRANIKTSIGNISYDIEMDQGIDSIYNYKGLVQVEDFMLGKLLSNDQVGSVALTTQINGRGFKLQDLNTQVIGAIQKVEYMQYSYENMTINGRIKDKLFDGFFAYDDKNLALNFNGLVNLSDSIPSYRFNLDLQRADLQALNITNDNIKLRAQVNANLSAKSLETLNGTLNVDGLTISKDEEVYQLDTVSLIAKSTSELTDFQFTSRIVDIDFKGNFELSTLPNVLQNHFDRYLTTPDSTSIDQLKAQDFDFTVEIKDPNFIQEVLVPDLEVLIPQKIAGNYNSELWKIDIDIILNRIVYSGISIDSLGIKVTSDKNSIDLTTKIASIDAGDLNFNNISLTGKAENNKIDTELKVTDDKGESKYLFGGDLTRHNDHYVYTFNEGEFILNYDNWKVNPNNHIDIGENYFWIQDALFSRSSQQIKFNSSVNDQQDSILTATFKNFDLSFIGKLKATEQYIIGGILDGDIKTNLNKKSLSADVGISDLSYLGDTLGNLNLIAKNDNNKTDINLELKSQNNELGVEGSIIAEEQVKLDLKAAINRLDIATIETFTAGQLSELTGTVTGDLSVKGTVVDPDINGQVKFNEVGLRVNYTGTKYFINKDQINFTKTGIKFDKFKVLDEQDNVLSLDGSINSEDYKEYIFNLEINAKKFKVLNTTKRENDLVFGKLSINTKAKITGNLNSPTVRLDISAVEGSNVNYIIPESNINVAERKGIVEFFDKDLEDDPFFQQQEIQKDTLESWITGIDLKANIKIDNSNIFSVIIDPVSGDKLTVSGDANLVLNVRPNGDMTLTGRYDINDGSYDFNFYGIARRKFDISKGSYLQWTGDPLNARLDVSATYFVRASPIEAEVRQKIPFIVFLDLKGELLSPEISFRLELEEEGSAPISVQAWMSRVNQQEAVLNKQVFSLLLFKTFASTGSTTGNESNIAQSTARNSVSRILSNQLNKLGDKIKGVELSFDLQSYEDYDESGNTIGRTELELGISKEFFNDRVIVKLAGDFDLEGQSQQNRNNNDFAGDIRIEYKLTEDGRYRLVGFRENEYDNLLQGEIAKTGVGVIFVRDYDAFKELFKKVESEEDEVEVVDEK